MNTKSNRIKPQDIYGTCYYCYESLERENAVPFRDLHYHENCIAEVKKNTPRAAFVNELHDNFYLYKFDSDVVDFDSIIRSILRDIEKHGGDIKNHLLMFKSDRIIAYVLTTVCAIKIVQSTSEERTVRQEVDSDYAVPITDLMVFEQLFK